MSNEAVKIETQWLTREVVNAMRKATQNAVNRSARAAARSVRTDTKGSSIARNVKVKSGKRGGGRRGGGRAVRQIIVESSRDEHGPPFHAVHDNWGTATRAGRHWGEAAVQAGRKTLDAAANGMLDRAIPSGDGEGDIPRPFGPPPSKGDWGGDNGV